MKNEKNDETYMKERNQKTDVCSEDIFLLELSSNKRERNQSVR